MNHQVRLRARPVGRVRASDFELVEAPVPEPGSGEVLLRVLWLSVDPAMRGWIALAKNYVEPVPLGAVMRGATVSEVLRSSHPGYARGDLVVGGNGRHLGIYLGHGRAISALTRRGVSVHRLHAVTQPFTGFLRTRLWRHR